MIHRQTNKFHCDLRHPTKVEMDRMRVNCRPVESDERAKEIEHDMLLAWVKIVDTHNRLIIQSAQQSSSPVIDSHASEEEVNEAEGLEEQSP